MSGLTERMRSTILLKSRVGFGCLMTSFTSKPCSGSDGQQRRRARAEQRVLVHDHHRARRRRRPGSAPPGPEWRARYSCDSPARSEGVLQPALDDLVGHARVDHMGQPVARRSAWSPGRSPRRRRRPRRTRRPPPFSRPRPSPPRDAIARRPAPPPARAAQRLDATGLVDVLDGQQRAQPALLARIGQRARHRMQHADFHGGRGLAARDPGRGQQAAAAADRVRK